MTRLLPPALLLTICFVGSLDAQPADPVKAAQTFRQGKQPVQPVSDATLLIEAEEFQPQGNDGWQAKPFGTNYYAGTFANCFLSRQAYLGFPEQGPAGAATITVHVPKAGKYLALVRYEAAYRFETRFRLQIEQQGQKKLDRLYGARDNLRIWAFREKLKKEHAWPWGAVENVVWEGHDAFVELQAGPAQLTLVAGKQPEPAAKRNVDLVMLTSDVEQVRQRIEKENFLPLDGMLTQANDVYLKVHSRGGDLKLTIPPGTEHSPYWVHLRTWKPMVLDVKAGQATDWVEVGSLLDTLSNGQWKLTAAGKGVAYDLEFGLKDAAGQIVPLNKVANLTGNVELAYDGATRYTRRVRLADDVLYDLVAYLKKQPVTGKPPQRTLIYGYTFAPKPSDPKYTAALEEFLRLTGGTAIGRDQVEDVNRGGLVRGYLDVRGVPTNKLEDYCKKLQAEGRADKIAVVSLGDEIGLAAPPANDHAGFRAWAQAKGLKPGDIDPAAGGDWQKVRYDPSPKVAATNPGQYYWSKIYAYRHGIKQLKERTDLLKKYLPHAGIGANFSPHHGHLYLGTTHQWVSLFREGGMTMPWGEDYVWQVPVGSQQMALIMLDLFRAGVRDKPDAKIHFYVMPHTPGNTPDSWRRLWYGALGHGAKVLNLFEYRPVQAAYTENHVNSPAMYQEVRRSIHELGTFEDIVQEGRVLPAKTAIFTSEAADVWDNHRAPFDVAKRSLYLMLRQQQVPLDFVVEGDDLKHYELIYLADANVSRAASRALADWVKNGGRLVATAGAGLLDEYNQPNATLRQLFGVEPKRLDEAKDVILFEKQDLPFAEPVATVEGGIPAFGVRGVVDAKGAKVVRGFTDGPPAVTVHQAGKGEATYFAFLPGLSYLQPAIPKRPTDRGATDDSMSHLLPTRVNPEVARMLPLPKNRPVVCSDNLVETTVIQAKQGTAVPLINWRPEPIQGLTVTLDLDVPAGSVTRASGRPVQVSRKDGKLVCTLDLDVADALILRK